MATTAIEETALDGVKAISPWPVRDGRGWVARVFCADIYGRAGIDHTRLVQESQSRSRRRTIRGLHMRRELSEAKLVRCVRGAIFDVVVDLRPWSPSFLGWERFELDDESQMQVYIPPGCAHGFQALTDVADVCYRVDAYYDPAVEAELAWDDAELAIPWPLAAPILSDRDRSAPPLREIRGLLEDWYGRGPSRLMDGPRIGSTGIGRTG